MVRPGWIVLAEPFDPVKSRCWGIVLDYVSTVRYGDDLEPCQFQQSKFRDLQQSYREEGPVEEGDHDELIALKGLYNGLYKMNYASFDDIPCEN